MTNSKAREEEILASVLADEQDRIEREFKMRMTTLIREIATLQRDRAQLDATIKDRQIMLRELSLTPFDATAILGK